MLRFLFPIFGAQRLIDLWNELEFCRPKTISSSPIRNFPTNIINSEYLKHLKSPSATESMCTCVYLLLLRERSEKALPADPHLSQSHLDTTGSDQPPLPTTIPLQLSECQKSQNVSVLCSLSAIFNKYFEILFLSLLV